MPRNILTVTLNPAIDKTVLNNGRVLITAGGKGVNVSRALRCLGVNSIACGIASGKAGKRLIDLIKEEGLKCCFTKGSGETRVNLTYLNQTSQRARKITNGPSLDMVQIKCFYRKYKSLLNRVKVVVLCGKNANNAPENLYARLISEARLKGILTFLDTRETSLFYGIKAKPTFIKPNIEEAQELLGLQLKSLKQIRLAINDLHAFGVKYVFITLGGRGVIASNSRECWQLTIPKVKLINDVGSGDAFIGGFIFGFIKKYSFINALKIAVASGTANCLTMLPGEVDRQEVYQIIKKIKCRKL